MLRRLLLLLWLVLLPVALTGCAVRQHNHGQRTKGGGPGTTVARAPHALPFAWPLATLAAVDRPRIGLPTRHGERWLETATIRSAWAAVQRVAAANPGAAPDYVLVDDPAPNAFAQSHGGRQLIGITVGMVLLLGEDEAAWAALIGHELAHLNLRHSEVQSQRQQDTDSIGAVAGILLTAIGLPLAPLLTDAATNVVEKGYSRDDERAADEAGIGYMRRAGYAPEGAVRLFEKLGGKGGSRLFGFLSTHPDSADRAAAAREVAERQGTMQP